MSAVLEATGRRLGFVSGNYDLEGRVYSVESDNGRASDPPPWSRATRWLAIAPTLGLLVAAALSIRMITSMFRGSGTQARAATPLASGLGGFILGDHLARRRPALVQVWRLDTGGGSRLVRIAIPPSHPSDVRVGDTLRCWVRPNRDGSFSVDRADNLRTGQMIVPTRPSALIIFGAAAWTGLFLFVVLPALVS